jgi:RHS repeat-associated protein
MFDDQKFTGHFLEQEGGLGIYHAQARMYDPETGRFWGVDAMRVKYPGISSYVYVANNPVIYVDPDGNDIWLVHGTFSDKDTWDQNSTIAYQEAFNDRLAEGGLFQWEAGGNIHDERVSAAKSLAHSIMEAYEASGREMEINIVGHSHGGNVAIMAANILDENNIQVDNLITIATPARSEYTLNEGAVSNHVNIYSQADPIQILGGFDTPSNPAVHTARSTRPSGISVQGRPAGRTQQGARNFNATGFAPNPVTAHTTIHNNIELIRGLRLFVQ